MYYRSGTDVTRAGRAIGQLADAAACATASSGRPEMRVIRSTGSSLLREEHLSRTVTDQAGDRARILGGTTVPATARR